MTTIDLDQLDAAIAERLRTARAAHTAGARLSSGLAAYEGARRDYRESGKPNDLTIAQEAAAQLPGLFAGSRADADAAEQAALSLLQLLGVEQ